MPRLLSVNVGLPRDVTWNGKTVRTAVWKSPVTERRMVRKLNIDGDAHDTTQEAAMSTNVVRSIDTSVARVDLKFEAVVIPVSDVDRAKEFYKSLGWRFDADFRFDNGFRIVQFTPPGSGCSVQFGTNITTAVPGSARGLYLVASDIEAARNELAAHAVEVSDVFHAGTPGAGFQSSNFRVINRRKTNDLWRSAENRRLY